MALFKNVASQKVAVFAYDTANDAPKTGDAANITSQISKDGGATAASNDANPTELDAADAPGIYLFDLTQAESNCDLFILNANSSTADISIEPVIIYTLPGSNAGVTPDAAGVRTAVGLASANLDTQLADLPTNAELATALAAADDAVLAAVAALNDLDAAGIRTAVGLATANLDTQLGNLPTAIENADAILSRGFANVEDAAELGSIAELLMGAFESAVAGTTWTIRKSGGSTFNTRTLTTSAAAEPITSVT